MVTVEPSPPDVSRTLPGLPPPPLLPPLPPPLVPVDGVVDATVFRCFGFMTVKYTGRMTASTTTAMIARTSAKMRGLRLVLVGWLRSSAKGSGSLLSAGGRRAPESLLECVGV